MEVVELTHLAKTHNVVHLTLFHSVSNIPSLLASLRAGAPDESLPKSITTEILSQYAFLDASVIVSRKHVLNAVMEALTRREMGDMKTRSWSTELMGVLWPGGNISDSLKHIGLGPKTSSLVVVRIASSEDTSAKRGAAILTEMTSIVGGSLDLRGLSALESDEDDGQASSTRTPDWQKVAQMHKLPALTAEPSAEDRDRMRAIVESATAIKNVAG